jgi:hypothetical protein
MRGMRAAAARGSLGTCYVDSDLSGYFKIQPAAPSKSIYIVKSLLCIEIRQY